MIAKGKITEIRHKLSAFFESSEKGTGFMVDCDLEFRIAFIYKAIFPGAGRFCFYFRFFISRIAYYFDYSPVKVFIYRMLGVKIGKGVFISPEVNIDVHFPHLISIDDYVILGYGTSIFCHDFIKNKYRVGRVHIGRGAVIGAYTNIGCGVSIGEQANIYVRSLILRDVPAFHNLEQVKTKPE